MHHDSQRIIFYHIFYLFFPIYKRKELKLFQLLENFKKNVLMHRPVAKDHPWLILKRGLVVVKEDSVSYQSINIGVGTRIEDVGQPNILVPLPPIT